MLSSIAKFDKLVVSQGQKHDIVAFKKDSYDNDVFIDGVYPGFVFELSDRINDTNSIKWLHNYWGCTHLLDLKLNSEKKNER